MSRLEEADQFCHAEKVDRNLREDIVESLREKISEIKKEAAEKVREIIKEAGLADDVRLDIQRDIEIEIEETRGSTEDNASVDFDEGFTGW